MLSHLDFVIVSSAREQRLIRVKVHPSDGSVVFVESIDQGSHAIVPQLDDAGVQRGEDPRPLRVERQAFHPVRFRLELGQHFLFFYTPRRVPSYTFAVRVSDNNKLSLCSVA